METIETTKGPIKYFEVSSFKKTGMVDHGFLTREGGVSYGPYKSLNVSLSVGDNIDNVYKNRQVLFKSLGFKKSGPMLLKQVHGSKVIALTESETFQLRNGLVGDAIVTDIPDLPVGILTADCIPILVLDKSSKVIAAIHAGWKGTVLKIVKKTIDKMINSFGCKPEGLIFALGPSIRACCYQVGEEYIKGIDPKNLADPSCIFEIGNDRWAVDLVKENVSQIIEYGIKKDMITVLELCTGCRKDLFFSYRRERGKTGRMFNFITLKGDSSEL